MALLSVRGEGLRKVMPSAEYTHEVVHGEFVRGIADDVGVSVSQAIGDVRSVVYAHRGSAIREVVPPGVEPSFAPVNDTTDAAALPKEVARVEVAVNEDLLGRTYRQTCCDGANGGGRQRIVFAGWCAPSLETGRQRDRTLSPVQRRFVQLRQRLRERADPRIDVVGRQV